ncbi:hypothetical protein DY000_02023409 [Brassica cretica]|uniref:Uncharacterized protein n=1 Tax=Brassica cretica TaxID=69181 RepID=A0ABQ7E229_BRACR|nr:hypothetical protein DY000_02023409 [Brassica cretica]
MAAQAPGDSPPSTQKCTSTHVPLMEESNWNQVSPGKVGRTYEQKQNHTVISPSRFQLLADDGDPIGNPVEEEEQNDLDQGSSPMMMDEVEEREILSKEDIIGEPVNKEGKIKKNKLFA